MNKEKMIKDFIYIQKCKLDYNTFNKNNQIAFKEIETEFFNKPEIQNLNFKTFNTIAFIIGDFVENNLKTQYESNIIKECLKVLENE